MPSRVRGLARFWSAKATLGRRRAVNQNIAMCEIWRGDENVQGNRERVVRVYKKRECVSGQEKVYPLIRGILDIISFEFKKRTRKVTGTI